MSPKRPVTNQDREHQETNDLARRASLLADIMGRPVEWRRWLVEHPARFAELLGVCDDGKRVIENDISRVLSRILPPSGAKPHIGGRTMPEKDLPPPIPPAANDYVQLANTLLNLLTIGLREKKKVDKLNALVTAYQQCCSVKDGLIEKYEGGNVATPAQKALARQIRRKLQELQRLLKEIQDLINNNQDASAKIIEAAALTGEIRSMLSNL